MLERNPAWIEPGLSSAREFVPVNLPPQYRPHLNFKGTHNNINSGWSHNYSRFNNSGQYYSNNNSRGPSQQSRPPFNRQPGPRSNHSFNHRGPTPGALNTYYHDPSTRSNHGYYSSNNGGWYPGSADYNRTRDKGEFDRSRDSVEYNRYHINSEYDHNRNNGGYNNTRSVGPYKGNRNDGPYSTNRTAGAYNNGRRDGPYNGHHNNHNSFDNRHHNNDRDIGAYYSNRSYYNNDNYQQVTSDQSQGTSYHSGSGSTRCDYLAQRSTYGRYPQSRSNESIAPPMPRTIDSMTNLQRRRHSSPHFPSSEPHHPIPTTEPPRISAEIGSPSPVMDQQVYGLRVSSEMDRVSPNDDSDPSQQGLLAVDDATEDTDTASQVSQDASVQSFDSAAETVTVDNDGHPTPLAHRASTPMAMPLPHGHSQPAASDSDDNEQELQSSPTQNNSVTMSPGASSPHGTNCEELQELLDRYFSPANLVQDVNLNEQMDSERWLPISAVAELDEVKQVTDDFDAVVDALKQSSVVSVDETEAWVKPHYRPRKTLIIYNLPEVTKPEDIEAFFEEAENPAVSVRKEIGNMWFIDFTTEAVAVAMLGHTRNGSIRGSAIPARLKSNPISGPDPVPITPGPEGEQLFCSSQHDGSTSSDITSWDASMITMPYRRFPADESLIPDDGLWFPPTSVGFPHQGSPYYYHAYSGSHAVSCYPTTTTSAPLFRSAGYYYNDYEWLSGISYESPYSSDHAANFHHGAESLQIHPLSPPHQHLGDFEAPSQQQAGGYDYYSPSARSSGGYNGSPSWSPHFHPQPGYPPCGYDLFDQGPHGDSHFEQEPRGYELFEQGPRGSNQFHQDLRRNSVFEHGPRGDGYQQAQALSSGNSSFSKSGGYRRVFPDTRTKNLKKKARKKAAAAKRAQQLAQERLGGESSETRAAADNSAVHPSVGWGEVKSTHEGGSLPPFSGSKLVNKPGTGISVTTEPRMNAKAGDARERQVSAEWTSPNTSSILDERDFPPLRSSSSNRGSNCGSGVLSSSGDAESTATRTPHHLSTRPTPHHPSTHPWGSESTSTLSSIVKAESLTGEPELKEVKAGSLTGGSELKEVNMKAGSERPAGVGQVSRIHHKQQHERPTLQQHQQPAFQKNQNPKQKQQNETRQAEQQQQHHESRQGQQQSAAKAWTILRHKSSGSQSSRSEQSDTESTGAQAIQALSTPQTPSVAHGSSTPNTPSPAHHATLTPHTPSTVLNYALALKSPSWTKETFQQQQLRLQQQRPQEKGRAGGKSSPQRLCQAVDWCRASCGRVEQEQ
ncbi:G protein-activated inward rectifier potassium channel 2 [Mortierella sp. GBA35]|nr:G protein-activated inward rectifier potassium channel 2 [Mortierella sp. GBA35]